MEQPLPEGRLLEGRHVLVTGGARGIGLAAVEKVVSLGATCTVVDLTSELASDEARRMQADGAIDVLESDVRDMVALTRVFDEALERHGRLDGCVTSAGVQEAAPSEQIEPERWQRVIDTNLTGVFFANQLAARIMLPQGSGSIVNIASAAAVRALPGRTPYTAAKAGVIGLTKALAVEWATRGVRVNAVGPGWVMTDLVRKAIDDGYLSEESIIAKTPMERLGTTAEIAEVIAFLLGPNSSYITGQAILPDGGYTA